MPKESEMKKAKKVLDSKNPKSVHKFLEVPKGKKPKILKMK